MTTDTPAPLTAPMLAEFKRTQHARRCAALAAAAEEWEQHGVPQMAAICRERLDALKGDDHDD